MTLRAYTPTKDAGKCSRCHATLQAGQPCEVLMEDGYVEHRHVTCERASTDGAALAARLMTDIRAGKPPATPHPTTRKVQGT